LTSSITEDVSDPLNTRLSARWSNGNETGIAKLIGFRMTSMEPDRAVVEFEPGPEHSNPMGTLHGGVLCDIADAAMGMAWIAGLAEGESFATIELKINFLRPVWSGKLTAEGKVIRRGRSVGYSECEIRDEAGRLVAKSSSTCMTLRGDQAAGR
jgi:uncharacterized protein (TIGR00369 family)